MSYLKHYQCGRYFTNFFFPLLLLYITALMVNPPPFVDFRAMDPAGLHYGRGRRESQVTERMQEFRMYFKITWIDLN